MARNLVTIVATRLMETTAATVAIVTAAPLVSGVVTTGQLACNERGLTLEELGDAWENLARKLCEW